MRPAYEALYKLAEEKWYVPTGVFYESYYYNLMDTEPEGLKTKILLPLKDH